MEGDMNWLVVLYTSLFYGILLFGVLFSSLCAVIGKGKEQPFFVGRLTMVGITVFLTIWECSSRYLVVFLPLMILMSGEGYVKLRGYILEKRGKRAEE